MLLLGWYGAAREGMLMEVQRILSAGEASVTDMLYGKTALLWAVLGGHLPVVEWLLREGGSFVAERDAEGYTALLLAALSRQWHLMRWFLVTGRASVLERNTKGSTALLIAVRTLNTLQVQRLLRECEADIADVDNDGNIWDQLHSALKTTTPQRMPSCVDLSDLYSVLRCYGSPAQPTFFLGGLECITGWEDHISEERTPSRRATGGRWTPFALATPCVAAADGERACQS
jgi:hypothetical protein